MRTTHLALQALLGCATRGGGRRELVWESFHLASGRGDYAGSTEELTPLRHDWLSVVPLTMTALALLVRPKFAATMAKKGWGAHLLDLKSIREIERADFR